MSTHAHTHEALFKKAGLIVLKNFLDYWKNPIVNKYLKISDENFGQAAGNTLEGILLIGKNLKQPIWLSHPFNYAQAKELLSGVEVKQFATKKDLDTIYAQAAKGVKTIGYHGRFENVNGLANLKKSFKGKKLVDVTDVIDATREYKDEYEVACISKAVQETQTVLDEIKNAALFAKGRASEKTNLAEIVQSSKSQLEKSLVFGKTTEKELAALIMQRFEADGFETAFCIVAFGVHTSHIHHANTTQTLTRGPVLIDVGAKYKGYSADLSASFWFGEDEDAQYRLAHEKVTRAISAVEKVLTSGVKASDLYATAEKVVGKMPHALGHGIGLEVHDVPSGIGEKSTWKLKEGMIIAIEPAIYTTDFGIRIEYNYRITKEGFENL